MGVSSFYYFTTLKKERNALLFGCNEPKNNRAAGILNANYLLNDLNLHGLELM